MERDLEPWKADLNIWAMRFQTLVTKPDGTDPSLGKCADLPNVEFEYQWPAPSGVIEAHCERIQLIGDGGLPKP